MKSEDFTHTMIRETVCAPCMRAKPSEASISRYLYRSFSCVGCGAECDSARAGSRRKRRGRPRGQSRPEHPVRHSQNDRVRLRWHICILRRASRQLRISGVGTQWSSENRLLCLSVPDRTRSTWFSTFCSKISRSRSTRVPSRGSVPKLLLTPARLCCKVRTSTPYPIVRTTSANFRPSPGRRRTKWE